MIWGNYSLVFHIVFLGFVLGYVLMCLNFVFKITHNLLAKVFVALKNLHYKRVGVLFSRDILVVYYLRDLHTNLPSCWSNFYFY